ncbi:MAG: ArsB/NhaD family transporter, partial [Bosea sp. (in: a-proteobacteria)]|nr:ArsB/NhaD family transporter [Bosea sp. (in: a-proteobacteria)]
MLSLAIFVATLVLVIWQPKGLGIGWSALGGAVVAMLVGVVGWADLGTVWGIVWDATFTFVGLIIISLILDEAGFFAWAALHVARWGGGNGRRLFPLVILLGAVIAAFFANDGAALLLTPIVLAILLRLNFPPAGAMAFIVACGFVADTTSLPLVISNLVNIVTANYFQISFGRYAAVMVPVNLVSLAATLVVLWVYFGRDVPASYAVGDLEKPSFAIKDNAVFRAAFPLLGVLLVAYFATAPLGIPIAFVTGAAALVLIAIAGRWTTGGKGAVVSVSKVLREAPWQIVLFSIGMYLVVYGL